MNLSDARNSIKELADALSVLAQASAGIKESDFDALRGRKTALETTIADLKKKVAEESSKASLEIANAQAAAQEKKAALSAEVAKTELALRELQTQLKVSRETSQNELREYKAKEISLKSAELKALNDTVAQRQRALDQINAQIEEGRRRFA